MLAPQPTERCQGLTPCPHGYESDSLLLSHSGDSCGTGLEDLWPGIFRMTWVGPNPDNPKLRGGGGGMILLLGYPTLRDLVWSMGSRDRLSVISFWPCCPPVT